MLHFTKGYCKAALRRATYLMQHALQAKLCSHGAVQSVVCVLSKLHFEQSHWVAPLYVIIFCPIICFKGVKSLSTLHGRSFVVKYVSTRKSAHSPLCQTYKVLRPWTFFLETTLQHEVIVLNKLGEFPVILTVRLCPKY